MNRRAAAAIVPRRMLRQRSVAGTGASAVAENAGIQSNFWAVPAAPNANDQEFNAATAPSGWAWYGGTSNGVLTTAGAVAAGAVDVLTAFATANAYKVSYSPVDRKSWLCSQQAPDNRLYAFAKVYSGGVANMLFRARLFAPYALTPLNNVGRAYLFLCGDAAGQPDTANRVEVGVEVDPSGAPPSAGTFIIGRNIVASVSTTVGQIVGSNNLPMPAPDTEVVLLKQGSTWYFFVRGSSGFTYLGSAVNAGPVGGLQWLGCYFTNNATGIQPFNPMNGCDYIRVENNPNFIP